MNKKNKIKSNYNNNKVLVFIYLITVVLTIISMFKEIESKNIKNVIVCFLSLFLLSVPFIVDKFKKVKFPPVLKITFILFVFSTIVLGEVNDFYELIPIWDDILHIVQGFFIASIGFSLMYMLFKKKVESNDRDKNKNSDKNKKINKDRIRFEKGLIVLFSFCLSISVGVVWEVGEYITDCNMNVDMQKDKYINEFNSILLNPKKDNEVMVVDKIGYTTIYDEYGKRIVTFNGYLDVGLHDTMDDLIDTLVGSLLFGVIGYLYLSNRERYRFVEMFFIKEKMNK